MLQNQTLSKIRNGQAAMGLWMNADSVLMAELGARDGFDWVLLDAQHGHWDYAGLVAATQVISATQATPLARVARNDPALIGKLLDMGMLGIVVPLVNSPEEAAAAVAASRYPPQGQRSLGGPRLGLYGADYFTAANSEVLVSVMIETDQAAHDAEAILAVPGVDLGFIGPADLALSMGTTPGTPDHEAAVQRVLQAGQSVGVPVGIYCGNAQEALRRAKQGFQFMPIMTDLGAYQQALRQAIGDWKAGQA